MLNYEHLLNRSFVYGTTDCYTLFRDFYRDNFSLEFADYARPDNWWLQGFNFFMDNYHQEGFRVVDDHPSEFHPADAIFMAIGSPVANHCAVLLPQGMILHHMPNRLSRVEPYRGMYRNATVAVLRHRDIHIPKEQGTVALMSLLPAHIKRKLNKNEEPPVAV